MSRIASQLFPIPHSPFPRSTPLTPLTQLTPLTPQDPETRRITDLISFYSLPSSIMKHAKHKVLNAAYMFYYASDVVFQPQTGGSADAADNAAWEEKNRQRLGKRLNRLVEDMMVVAKNVSRFVDHVDRGWCLCASYTGQ